MTRYFVTSSSVANEMVDGRFSFVVQSDMSNINSAMQRTFKTISSTNYVLFLARLHLLLLRFHILVANLTIKSTKVISIYTSTQVYVSIYTAVHIAASQLLKQI